MSPLAQQGPLPYLAYGSLELSNEARTVAYLNNGLADQSQGHFIMGDGSPCSVLYRLASTNCTPTVFVSPATDPAPWYDPLEPGSESFLGLVLLDINGYDSTITRNVVNRYYGLGGGTFGSQQRNPRVWKFQGVMISADDTGAEYGLRWLTSVLQASECDDCSTTSLSVRLACPPADCSDDDLGLWTSYAVALTAGPTEGDLITGQTDGYMGGQRDAILLDFTVTAANPFLYQAPVACLTAMIGEGSGCTDICDFLFGGGAVTACCDVTAPNQGVTGAIAAFTNMGTTDAGSVYVAYYPGCDSAGATSVIVVDTIPAGSTVTVDSAQHIVTLTNPDGSTEDAQDLVTLADGAAIQWVEIRDCDPDGCFCIGPYSCFSGSVEVVVTAQNRQG